MSRSDFERCTPLEFRAVFDAWQQRQEQQERGEWERVRMLCLCSLQPFSNKSLRANDVMEFPWEKTGSMQGERQEKSRAEILSRFEKARRRYGMR